MMEATKKTWHYLHYYFLSMEFFASPASLKTYHLLVFYYLIL